MLDAIRQPDQIDPDWQPYVDAMRFMEEKFGIKAPDQMGRDRHEFFIINGELVLYYGDKTALLHGIALGVQGRELTTLANEKGSEGIFAIIDRIRESLPFGVGKRFRDMKYGLDLYSTVQNEL